MPPTPFINGRKVSGVIDWEESDDDGIPSLDAICLVFSCYSQLSDKFRGTESLLEMSKMHRNFAPYIEPLQLYYDKTDVDPGLHEGLVLLYWLNVVSHRLDLGQAIKGSRYGQLTQQIVDKILSTSGR